VTTDDERQTAIEAAALAIRRGELIVIPTDTVYGVGADAFNAAAVQRLLDAKGRGRHSPPPVLLPGIPTLDALAETVPDEVRELVTKFWPGGLTIILAARSSLTWDLGETRGTVALRMPSNRIALELLSETGPLAVSSANATGLPAAETAQDAERMLGDSVKVYLDDGQGGSVPSTIVDATALALPEGKLRLVREGVIPVDAIRELLGADRVSS
jgi:tRNA threonylcarbamoyl adenosine modification protein (Sua5/YciO/YrdC/YwlC family)